MTKELFIECIEALEKQSEIDSEMADNLGKAFPNVFSGDFLPDNRVVEEMLIKVLKTEMKDCCDWIGYYCWELDFGKENWRLKVYKKEGDEIPLKTAEDLYNLLTNINENNKSNIRK